MNNLIIYCAIRLNGVQVPKPVKMMITNIQMAQFLLMNAQSIIINVIMDCPFPANLNWVYLVR